MTVSEIFDSVDFEQHEKNCDYAGLGDKTHHVQVCEGRMKFIIDLLLQSFQTLILDEVSIVSEVC
jgi:hypothetical protein